MSNLTSSAAHKAISAVHGPVNLRKYTKIKPEVARQLFCFDDIDLSGLKELTPELAEAFGGHRGGLILGGLISLSPETAKALKEHFHGSLEFGSIETLDDLVALDLSQRVAGDGDHKYWPKTTFPAIKKFEDTPGHLAFFSKLIHNVSHHSLRMETITPRQADILVRRCEDINCPHVKFIDKEVAQVLSKTSKAISLREIQTLDVETALALSNHRGELKLTGLGFVSDELALALSKHSGKLDISGLTHMPDTEGYLALARKLAADDKENFRRWVSTLGAKVAEIFSECDKVSLFNLTELPETPEHKRLLEKMCYWDVSLRSLTDIPDSMLSILAACPHEVDLGGPNNWTEGEGHIAWVKRLTVSKPTGGFLEVYAHGKFFPDKIAQIFAETDNVKTNGVSEFDSSPGNLALAKKLASTDNHISLTKVTPEVAEIFAMGTNKNYKVIDLEEIDAKSFELFFRIADCIYLSKIKQLSPEIARLTEGKRNLGFDSITEINLEVAQCLGNGEGSLNLRGIKKIGNDCLAALSRRKGELNLEGLETLTEDQAEILSKSNGNLNLSGLTETSDESLAKLLDLDPSKNISLPKLTRISDENALKLSQRVGDVDISAIESLEDTVGRIAFAAKFAKGWRSKLSNLQKLGPKSAAELAKSSSLAICGLSKMSPETAEALSKVSARLVLNDFCEVSKEVAEKLSAYSEDLTVGNMDNVADDIFAVLMSNKKRVTLSITDLTPAKAKALSKVPSLCIQKLETISYESALCFKGYKGDMYLPDLCRLSPEAAQELLKLKRRVSSCKQGETALYTGA